MSAPTAPDAAHEAAAEDRDLGRPRDEVRARRLPSLGGTATIYLVLVAVLAWMFFLQPTLLEPQNLLAFFVKPLVPVALLAVGQMFVVAAGDFDLSVGALVTFGAVLASEVVAGDEGRWVLGITAVMVAALLVGLVNAVVATRLKVPSLLGTLGMLLALDGLARLITDGVPRNVLPDSFRRWGRSGFDLDPVLNQLPYSLVIALPLVAGAWWLLHRTTFGTQVLVVGGNPQAAAMSGVPVQRVRLKAFLVSSLLAGVAAVLLAGFSSVSLDLGTGLEFQAIAAVVLGGAVLGGGKGSVPAALAGATTLAALFTVLNLLGLDQPLRLTVQGLILIVAVAVSVRRERTSR